MQTFPCCKRLLSDDQCCEDECCTCCHDCGPVVCCCLEIRLVSRSETDESSKAAKYVENSKTKFNQSRESQTRGDKSNEMGTESVKRENVRPGKGKSKTVTSQTTAKSAHHSKPSNTVPLPSKQQRTGKPKTKMKASSDVSEHSDSVSKSPPKKAPRSLPSRPSQQQVPSSGAPKRIKRESGSELKEVPVIPYDTPLCSARGGAPVLEIMRSDPDLVLGLPQQYDLVSLSSRTEALNRSICQAGDRLKPGSVVDGSSTHRSVGAGSVYSGFTLETISICAEQLTSPRPLPIPPQR